MLFLLLFSFSVSRPHLSAYSVTYMVMGDTSSCGCSSPSAFASMSYVASTPGSTSRPLGATAAVWGKEKRSDCQIGSYKTFHFFEVACEQGAWGRACAPRPLPAPEEAAACKARAAAVSAVFAISVVVWFGPSRAQLSENYV